MLCDGKSLGADGLHSEVIKSSGLKSLIKVSYSVVRGAWTNLEIPSDWKDVQLVTVFKKETDLWQLSWDLTSVYTSESIRPYIAKQTCNSC